MYLARIQQEGGAGSQYLQSDGRCSIAPSAAKGDMRELRFRTVNAVRVGRTNMVELVQLK